MQVCLQYEPELFPGLIYRMKQPKIVLLIFVSGKVVLTGELCNNNCFSALLAHLIIHQAFASDFCFAVSTVSITHAKCIAAIVRRCQIQGGDL